LLISENLTNGFPPCATAKAKATRGRGNDKGKLQSYIRYYALLKHFLQEATSLF